MATRTIFKKISECLHFITRQLEIVENHFGDSIRCVIHSPNLSASQIMSFLISSQMQDKDSDPIVGLQKQHGLLDLHRTLEIEKGISKFINFSDAIWKEI